MIHTDETIRPEEFVPENHNTSTPCTSVLLDNTDIDGLYVPPDSVICEAIDMPYRLACMLMFEPKHCTNTVAAYFVRTPEGWKEYLPDKNGNLHLPEYTEICAIQVRHAPLGNKITEYLLHDIDSCSAAICEILHNPIISEVFIDYLPECRQLTKVRDILTKFDCVDNVVTAIDNLLNHDHIMSVVSKIYREIEARIIGYDNWTGMLALVKPFENNPFPAVPPLVVINSPRGKKYDCTYIDDNKPYTICRSNLIPIGLANNDEIYNIKQIITQSQEEELGGRTYVSYNHILETVILLVEEKRFFCRRRPTIPRAAIDNASIKACINNPISLSGMITLALGPHSDLVREIKMYYMGIVCINQIIEDVIDKFALY